MVKASYDQPTADIILNGKELKAFPPKPGISQRCPLSPVMQYSPQNREVGQEREIKRHVYKKQ